MKNILFVCRYNRFRSKFAEGFFNALNTNDEIVAKSAGLFKGNPINESIFANARDCNIEITSEPQAISEELLNWQDIIVIVANNVPQEIFNDHRIQSEQIIQWDIAEKETEEVIDSIKSNITELLREIT